VKVRSADSDSFVEVSFLPLLDLERSLTVAVLVPSE
jgi:hypothetical protein